MTTKILAPSIVRDMVNQLERLGAVVDWSDTGVVVKAPKSGKEAFRAMHGTGGNMLARWPDGLFDERGAGA
jgi:valyl-tRNA synthetase